VILRVRIGEEEAMKKKRDGKFDYRKIRAWVKTIDSAYTGTIYLPADQTRFSDVMNDERQFISMTDVESKDFASPKSYLAINKDLIELVEILEPDLKD
jgi:Family of unknown function (DUF6812)